MPFPALFTDDLPMCSQHPREFPITNEELVDLTRRAGAMPGYRSRPWDSIPLLQQIEGRKGYLADLQKASVTLYKLLCQDTLVQGHIQADKTVVLGGKEKGKLPAMPGKAAPQALLALQYILHSCAYISSSPLIRNKAKLERRSYIGIPLNRNEFVTGQPYGHLSYEIFRGMIYAMAVAMVPRHQTSWLEYVHPNIKKRTRIGPTEQFRTWMVQAGLIFPNHPLGQKKGWPRAKSALLWLTPNPESEDFQKDEIRQPLLRPLQGDEMILPALNDQLSKLQISCPLPDYAAYERHYDFTSGRSKLRLSGNKQLYRSFSYADGRGGRLYGSWVQSVPSSLRQYLVINGRPTTELDYANMQLVLLYAMQGISAPAGDLYEIPGQLREVMKLVLTVSVGSKTKSDALGAIRKKLQDDNSIRHRPGAAEHYYKAFWGYHGAVHPHSGKTNQVWAELQYADSQIALRVLRYLLEQGIPAIPIHDSFIVQEQHHEALSITMKTAWKDFWPASSVEIR